MSRLCVRMTSLIMAITTLSLLMINSGCSRPDSQPPETSRAIPSRATAFVSLPTRPVQSPSPNVSPTTADGSIPRAGRGAAGDPGSAPGRPSATMPTPTVAAAQPSGPGSSANTVTQPQNPLASATPFSPLKFKSVPPAGVPRQLSFIGGGGGGTRYEETEGCSSTPKLNPRIITSDLQGLQAVPEAEKLDEFAIVAVGFAPNRNILVQVTYPDGKVDPYNLKPYCLGSHREWGAPLEWIGLPGEPAGRYRISASQEGLQGAKVVAQGAFNIIPAKQPRISIPVDFFNTSGTVYVGPGNPVSIYLSGFRPGTQVPLYLYRSGKCPDDREKTCPEYATELQIRVDDRGEAHYLLRTQPDDPEDEYTITAGTYDERKPYLTAGFVLRR